MTDLGRLSRNNFLLLGLLALDQIRRSPAISSWTLQAPHSAALHHNLSQPFLLCFQLRHLLF